MATLRNQKQQRWVHLTWTNTGVLTLQIPREQSSYRLASYRDHLAAAGVLLAQSTRYRALFVPTLGSDMGGYFSHIWRESDKSVQSW